MTQDKGDERNLIWFLLSNLRETQASAHPVKNTNFLYHLAKGCAFNVHIFTLFFIL